MEQCLACLLTDEYQCNDCNKPLCQGCIKWYCWEENDYSSEDEEGHCAVLTFDIELCEDCFRNR